jgi:hypothetical protein
MNILFSRRKVLATGAIGVAARAAAHAAGEPTMSQASNEQSFRHITDNPG